MRKIVIVGTYEAKMLLRTWKFWILAVLGMFFPILMNVAIVIMRKFGEGPGEFHLESASAYLLFYFYSYAQAIVIVFLASDFREKDKKAKIDEVMSSRPVSNFQYIFGKYLGLMIPIIILALIVVFLSVILNLIVNKSLIINPYFKLLILMNIPALIFITAFIIFISSLVRNSAIVFLVIGGYMFLIIKTLAGNIWSANKLYFLLDYGCFFLPMFPSDMVGIVNTGFIVMQRVFYVCLGLFFIHISVVLYPRLKQSKFQAAAFLIIGILFLSVSLSIFNNFYVDERERKNIIAREHQAGKDINNPGNLEIKHYDFTIDLFRNEKPLSVACSIGLEKKSNYAGDTVIFHLNPGLKIESIRDEENHELAFTRKESNVIVETKNSRIVGESEVFSLIITYTGTIDERHNFINREENDRGEIDKYDGPWMKENVTHMLQRNNTFLFSESNWYPALGKAYGYTYPEKEPVSFFTMEATITTLDGIEVLTQGDLIEKRGGENENVTLWKSSIPLSKLTLNAGKYTVISDTVDNIVMRLYYSPKHKETIEFFKGSEESIITLVKDVLYTIENSMGLTYPYNTLTFVETPLQLQWFRQKGIMKNLMAPPGIVMLREEVLAASFKEIFNRVKRNAERRKEDLTEDEMRKRVFLRFLEERLFDINSWNAEKFSNPIQSYWTHRLNFTGKGYPIFEYFLNEYFTEIVSRNIYRMIYPHSRERVEIVGHLNNWEYENRYDVKIDTLFSALRKTPLIDLQPERQPKLFYAAMKFKGTRLFSILKEYLGEEGQKKAMREFVERRSYRSSEIKDFLAVAEDVTGKELDWFYSDWIKGTSFPGYVLENVEAYKVRGGEKGVLYQVNARITNGEPSSGFIKVILRYDEGESVKQLQVEGNSTVEVGFTSNVQPEALVVDPIFAQNRSVINKNISVPERFSKVQLWDGIRNVTSEFGDKYEIIVDDLDEGFKTTSNEKARYFRPKSSNDGWDLREDSDAFGKYKRSYRRKDPGNGNSTAIWEAEIPEKGLYNVYIYMYKGNSWFERQLRNRTATDYHYKIKHADGEEDIHLSWKDAAPGWNFVGRFYYDEGSMAKITLTDDANGLLIIDAVKWEYATNGDITKK